MFSWMFWKSNKEPSNAERFELLDGDYTSQDADGSRDLSWGWYPVKPTADAIPSGKVPTGRTRERRGRIEHEYFSGVWFGREVKDWLFKGDDGKWYHADPPGRRS